MTGQHRPPQDGPPTIDPELFFPPGSFFLTKIGGATGWWVGLAQALVGIPSRWTHAGIVGHNGQTWEAAPGGVRPGTVDDLLSKPHIVCDAPVLEAVGAARLPELLGAREDFEAHLREAVVDQAAAHLGAGYSFLDYLALGLHHLAPRARVTRWARERVRDSEHYICSAFVDHVYAHCLVHLYVDGRLHGDVTPSDLDAWADEHGHIVRRVRA